MNKNSQQLLWDLYASIAMNVIITFIKGPICGYCIFENVLMEFIIKNDVGIICYKSGYCLKNL